MAKVKIITKPVRTGKYIYSVGEVEFDNKGIATVDADKLDELLDSDVRLSILGKDENDKIDQEISFEDSLKKMNKTELLNLAKEANLPEDEYTPLNKEKLVQYLLANTADDKE